jgi:hypothetical protein
MNGARGNYRSTARRGATALLFVAALPALFETRLNAAHRGPLSPEIQLALRRAVQKVSRPECQLVYSDFSDSLGTALAQNLAERGQSAAVHLQELIFEDADQKPRCHSGGILAFTSPGSRTVHLCTQGLTLKMLDGSGVAVATLIHEQLHTLGLLENPPTSREITERVLQRCGR